MSNNHLSIEANTSCVKFFFENLEPKELTKAERKALMHGAKIIEQAAKRNYITRWPAVKSTKHGDAIIGGLYKKINKTSDKQLYAMVSIMGEPKKRKNGSRIGLLKYFERGTEMRYYLGSTDSARTESRILRKKYGNDIFYGRNKSTGKIFKNKGGLFAFRDAKNESKEMIFDAIKEHMNEKIAEAVAKAIAKSKV